MKATRRYIEGLTTAIALETGIKFRESGKGWYVNVKDRTLFYDPLDLVQREASLVKGLILHEVGHLLYTEPTGKDSKIAQKHPAMQDVYNALEDIRIEHLLIEKYRDFARYPLEYVATLGFSMNKKNPRKATLRDTLLQLCAFQCNTNAVTEQAKKASKDFWDSPKNDLLDTWTNCSSRLRYICKEPNVASLKIYCDKVIYPLIKHLLPDADKKKRMRGLAESIGGRGKGSSLSDKKMPPPQGAITGLEADQELKSLLACQISTLAYRLGNILREQKASFFTGSHLRGKLLSKNAYKVLTDDKRPFSRLVKPNKPDYKITFVLDNSGSMRDSSQKDTYIATFLLVEVCKKLGLSYDILRYDSDVIKIGLEDYRQVANGDNNDDLAVKTAIDYLDKKKENIVFMLTDGGVCSDPTEAIKEITKKAIFVPVGVGPAVNMADFKKYYPNPVLVGDTQQLPDVLVKELQRIIHR